MNYNESLFFEDPDNFDSGGILMNDLITSPSFSQNTDDGRFNYTAYLNNTDSVTDYYFQGEDESRSSRQGSQKLTGSIGNPESVDSESGNSSRLQHSEIEKRRRDNMNTLITELSQMIPLCSSSNRKLDKLTVLRMTVQQLKTLQSNASTSSEASHRPSFFSEEEMKHIILSVAEGFLFVLACDRGRVLFVSESVNGILDCQVQELVGQSIFDIVHNRDIPTIKENLISPEMNVEERLIDSKTLQPVKMRLPKHQTPLSSGNRRSFFCRFKLGSQKIGSGGSGSASGNTYAGGGGGGSTGSKRSKSESKRYLPVHCTGYIKSWATNSDDQEIGEEDDRFTQLACLVMIGRPLEHLKVATSRGPQSIDCFFPLRINFRLELEGTFIAVDHLAAVLLDYLPQELIGTSIYVYIHANNVNTFANLHKQVLQTYNKMSMSHIQIKTKSSGFCSFQLQMYCFVNPLTDNPEFLSCAFDLLKESKIGQKGEVNTELADTPLSIEAETSIPSLRPTKKERSWLDTSVNVSEIGSTIVESLHENQQNQEIEEMRMMALQYIQQFTECNTTTSSLDATQIEASIRMNTLKVSNSNEQGIRSILPSLHSVPQNHGEGASSQSQTGMRLPLTLEPISPPANEGRLNGLSKSIPTSVILNLRDEEDTPGGSNNDGDEDNHSNRGDDSNVGGDSLSTGGARAGSVGPGGAVGELSDSPATSQTSGDEAAMSVLMSLLEADAGLGGPVDFTSIPWPL